MRSALSSVKEFFWNMGVRLLLWGGLILYASIGIFVYIGQNVYPFVVLYVVFMFFKMFL